MTSPRSERALPLAILAATSTAASAAPPPEPARIAEVVITAVRMEAPLTLVTDPKLPRQPLPAHDGADYLKTIPGFAVIRKGGTDGDPVFRGMAASRINVLLDGAQTLGGCGNRMDPPTAYVYPESFDRIVVVKGPQTVRDGPGNSAATVRFERVPPGIEQRGLRASASALGASAGRSDLVGELQLASPSAYARLGATHAEADDYDDGDGVAVHGRYERWSANAALGLRPDERTLLELSGTLSDGEAAYADRSMDGVGFAREAVGVKLEREFARSALRTLRAHASYGYVDHVMDNFSLRRFVPSAGMPGGAVANPDRRTRGGKIEAELALAHAAVLTLGLDAQDNHHSVRSTSNQALSPYEAQPRRADASFRDTGLFGELQLPLQQRSRIIAGARADRWRARDERTTVRVGMGTAPNPSAGAHREETLTGGFMRYEHTHARRPVTSYVGVGHVQRFPDYWELISGKESAGSLSAFDTRPERTTQLDAGLLLRHERLSVSLSGFYSDVEDFILIQSNYPKGMRRTTITRNVDASTWGGEADAEYALSARWTLGAALAFTHGENDTDGLPLAQIAPLEARIGLGYQGAAVAAGVLVRRVAEQDRVAPDQGNVVGQDLGATGGFTVLSANAAWRAAERLTVSAGVDNLLDRSYAEHLSRAGAMVGGFEQTRRVNEPGRTLWLRVSAALE